MGPEIRREDAVSAATRNRAIAVESSELLTDVMVRQPRRSTRAQQLAWPVIGVINTAHSAGLRSPLAAFRKGLEESARSRGAMWQAR